MKQWLRATTIGYRYRDMNKLYCDLFRAGLRMLLHIYVCLRFPYCRWYRACLNMVYSTNFRFDLWVRGSYKVSDGQATNFHIGGVLVCERWDIYVCILMCSHYARIRVHVFFVSCKCSMRRDYKCSSCAWLLDLLQAFLNIITSKHFRACSQKFTCAVPPI